MRRGSGGTTGPTQSVSASASLTRLTSAQLGVHVRSTTYDGPASAGTLQSVALEGTLFNVLHLQYTGGVRQSTLTTGTAPPRTIWTSADADIGLGRSVYLMLSSYRETSDTDRSLQTYVSISYRF